MAEVYYRELSFEIIGCAQRVHAELGPGFPESVYQRALIVELIKAKIPFESEKTFEVYYQAHLCGEFRCDIIAKEAIVLELKALDRLTNEHLAQALSYLKATGLKLAILINFGKASLEHQRVVR